MFTPGYEERCSHDLVNYHSGRTTTTLSWGQDGWGGGARSLLILNDQSVGLGLDVGGGGSLGAHSTAKNRQIRSLLYITFTKYF